MNTPGKATLTFLGAAALAGALAQLLPAGPAREGALIGLCAGLASGLLALGWTARTTTRGLGSALLALGGGFALRMLLVPLALLWARSRHDDLLATACCFFALYVLGQALEISLIGARPRAQEQA